MRIFVSIVSYRDDLLADTILNLIGTKSGLSQITIGVFEQTKYEDSLAAKHPELVQMPWIRYKRIDPEYSAGVGWARHINSLQMTDEDYYYQIDSHAQFDVNWDRELLKDYKLAVEKYRNDRIVVTTNCKNYFLNEEGRPVKEGENEQITCKSTYFYFQKDYIIGAHGEWIDAQPNVTDAIHIFAGNLFTRSDWVHEVGVNPKMFFEGEEQYLTLASFAAGYQLCHPREIHCYHYIGSTEYKTKPWIEPVIPQRQIDKMQHISRLTLKAFIMSLDDEILEAYRKYSGIDYINRKIEKRALSWTYKAPAEMVNDWEIPDRID
jgi:hypothetical protein